MKGLDLVDRVCAPTENDVSDDDKELARRRAALAHAYCSLPAYASEAFWLAVGSADVPLEVLVRCVRLAISRHDAPGRKRLLEIIVGRVQRSNEEWAQRVLLQSAMRADERNTLVYDLCIDLYEALFRALMDTARLFWEENFWHCLRFERQHIHHAFLVREGLRVDQQVKRAQRVPRPLMNRLQGAEGDGGHVGMEIEDERAQKLLLAVEHDELLQQVLRLPDRLKAVVLLLYWEGRTEKEVARVLGITDRTVRNRLQNALKLLRAVV